MRYTKLNKLLSAFLSVTMTVSLMAPGISAEEPQNAESVPDIPQTVMEQFAAAEVKRAQAQIGTDKGYNGAKEPLEKSLYTFTETESGKYTVMGMAGETPVYLAIRAADLKNDGSKKVGFPFTKTSVAVNLVKNADGTVSFWDHDETGLNKDDGYLYFFRADGKEPVFDAVTRNMDECHFELYQLTDTEIEGTDIAGFVKVAPENIQSGEKYLIVANKSGVKYALHPSTDTTIKYAHVVKVVEPDTTEPEPEEPKNYEYDLVLPDEISGVKTNSEETTSEKAPAINAFDGDENTIWHSNYSNQGDFHGARPYTIEWQVGDTPKNIGKIEYYKRKGQDNGNWQNVKIEGQAADGNWIVLADNQAIDDACSSAVFEFAPQLIKVLKITVNQGKNNFASAAEIKTFETVEVDAVNAKRQELRSKCAEAVKFPPMEESSFKAELYDALHKALQDAKAFLATSKGNDDAVTAEAQKHLDALTAAIHAMQNAGLEDIDVNRLAPKEHAPGYFVGDEPLATGVGGCANFRIPALITLKHQKDASKNGRILAAADARWDHYQDAWAIDTILSRSSDGGKSWDYSFPICFNDSTNGVIDWNTTIIDPVLAEAHNGDIYLMSDVFPAGVATWPYTTRNPSVDTGYREIGGKQRMILYTDVGTAQNENNYTHYVGDFSDTVKTEDGKKLAPVIAANDENKTPVYYVDQWFYLYDLNQKPMVCAQLGNASHPTSKYIQQNLFFKNAALHVREATFLWMVKSTDGGETWNAPVILNPMVRPNPADRTFRGVGPGSGLSFVDANGVNVILLPTYISMPNTNEQATFVYSYDEGETWHSAPLATNGKSSESTLVQIDDTTVRQFHRDYSNALNYTDYTWNPTEHTFTTTRQEAAVPNAVKKENNQLSSIRLEKTQYLGKPVVLVSTAGRVPSNSWDRYDGRIHVMTLEQDNSLKLVKTYEVNNDWYGYSCLSELANGDIGLLYEGPVRVPANGSEHEDMYFKKIPVKDLLPEVQEISLKQGESTTISVDGTISFESDNTTVQAEVEPVYSDKSLGKTGTNAQFTGETEELSTALYTFTKKGNQYEITANTADGAKVYLAIRHAEQAGAPFSTTSNLVTVEKKGDFFAFNDAGDGWLYFWHDGKNRFDRALYNAQNSIFDLYRPANENEEPSTEIPGFVKATEVVDGGQYLIVAKAGSDHFVLRPSASTTDKYSHVLKVVNGPVGYQLTLTGKKIGEATVAAGSKTIHVTVTAPTPIMYTVTIDGKKYQIENGKTLGDKLPTEAVKDGYAFKGWQDENGNTVTSKTVVTGDMTITAQYNKLFNVTIDGKTYQIEDGKTLSDKLPAEATKDGYVFKGWQDANGKAVTSETMVKSDMTITAQYNELFNVTIDGKEYQFENGEKLGDKLPTTVPDKDGSKFTAWVDANGNIVTAETVVTGNLNIRAAYEMLPLNPAEEQIKPKPEDNSNKPDENTDKPVTPEQDQKPTPAAPVNGATQTGDATHMLAWLATAAMMAVGAILTYRKLRFNK